MESCSQETELNTLGMAIEAVRKELVQVRDTLKQKKDYLFGSLPEKPENGKICGSLPGIIGNLKADVAHCACLAQEIRALSAEIARL